jgi:hypothetical protein
MNLEKDVCECLNSIELTQDGILGHGDETVSPGVKEMPLQTFWLK